MKWFVSLLLFLVSTIALADAPVIWYGTTAKWLPGGLHSAGLSKLDAAGVLTPYTTNGIVKMSSGVPGAAVSGTDYAPATSGSSLLYGNGAGGFSNATVGATLSFSGGTLGVATGTNNGVAYFNGSGVLSSGSSLVWNGTQLGVNGAPSYNLDSYFSSAGGNPAIRAYGDGAYGGVLWIENTQALHDSNRIVFRGLGGTSLWSLVTDAGFTNTADFSIVDSADGKTPLYFQNSTAFVGINNTSPGKQLDVTGTARVSSTVTLTSLTASQAVVTDASKNLASLPYTTAGAASSFLELDANSYGTANNFAGGYQATTSAAGTNTLAVSATQNQTLTGTSTQTTKMAAANSLPQAGVSFFFNNNSTGAWTIQDNSAGAIITIPAGGAARISLTDNSTAAGVWDARPLLPKAAVIGTTGAGILRSTSGGVWSSAELSGDATTSASNAVTVVKVNGVSYGTSPSTNTVPVVTGSNTVTYETVPNAALSNSSMTIAGHSVSLGGTQTIACGDLSNGAASCSTDTTNASNISSGLLATARVAAGRTINAQTGTSYTFVLADGASQGGHPLVTSSNASTQTLTVPPNSSVAYPTGDQIDVCQVGAGKMTIAAGSGVTINSNGSLLSAAGQYICLTLIKTATNTWLLIGNLGS